jgi:hypothetical protein
MAKAKHAETAPVGAQAPQTEEPKKGVLVETEPDKGNPLVRMDAALTTTDLVALRLCGKQEKFQKSLNDALRKAKQLEKDIKQKSSRLEDGAKKEALEGLVNKVGPLNDALRATGSRHHVVPFAEVDLHKREVLSRIDMQRPHMQGKVTTQVVDTLVYEVKPFTDGQNAAADEVKDLTRQLTDTQEVVVAWKRELADMSKHERKAVAKVVAHRLSQSEEGRSLLERLTADDTDDDDLPPLLGYNS